MLFQYTKETAKKLKAEAERQLEHPKGDHETAARVLLEVAAWEEKNGTGDTESK